jgi:serine/threonine protein kinase
VHYLWTAPAQPGAHANNRRWSIFPKWLFNCHRSSCVIGRFSLALVRPVSQEIGRATDASSAAVKNVGVDHRCSNVVVAQQPLILMIDGEGVKQFLALKVLLSQHRDRCDLVDRFVEEAQICGQLQHPGVVPVYELGTLADHRPFFTMKLVKGQTLAALLAERSSPDDDHPHFLSIFEAVCQT